MWVVIDHIVLHNIVVVGFAPILKLQPIKIDNALVTSLDKRWESTTNTFQFPHGEVTINLQEIEVLLGLRVDGEAVVGRQPIGSLEHQYALGLICVMHY